MSGQGGHERGEEEGDKGSGLRPGKVWALQVLAVERHLHPL